MLHPIYLFFHLVAEYNFYVFFKKIVWVPNCIDIDCKKKKFQHFSKNSCPRNPLISMGLASETRMVGHVLTRRGPEQEDPYALMGHMNGGCFNEVTLLRFALNRLLLAQMN